MVTPGHMTSIAFELRMRERSFRRIPPQYSAPRYATCNRCTIHIAEQLFRSTCGTGMHKEPRLSGSTRFSLWVIFLWLAKRLGFGAVKQEQLNLVIVPS